MVWILDSSELRLVPMVRFWRKLYVETGIPVFFFAILAEADSDPACKINYFYLSFQMLKWIDFNGYHINWRLYFSS